MKKLFIIMNLSLLSIIFHQIDGRIMPLPITDPVNYIRYIGSSFDLTDSILVIGNSRFDRQPSIVYVYKRDAVSGWKCSQKMISDSIQAWIGTSVCVSDSLLFFDSQTNGSRTLVYASNGDGTFTFLTDSIRMAATFRMNSCFLNRMAFGSDPPTIYTVNKTNGEYSCMRFPDSLSDKTPLKNVELHVLYKGISVVGLSTTPVCIFTEINGKWTESAIFKGINCFEGQILHYPVDVDDNVVFIGSCNDRKVYICKKTGSGWSFTDTLASDSVNGRLYGASVGYDKGILIAGALNKIFVYEYNGNKATLFDTIPVPYRFRDESYGRKSKIMDSIVVTDIYDNSVAVLSIDLRDPFARIDKYEMLAGDTLRVDSARGLLGNDKMLSRQKMTCIVFGGPRHGKLNNSPNGSFSYVPVSRYLGYDTLHYLAVSGSRESDTGLAIIQINREFCEKKYGEIKIMPDLKQDDHFGSSIGIYGDYLIAGALHDDQAGYGSGAAYIYKLDSGTWKQQAKVAGGDLVPGSNAGTSVSIYSNYALIGAPNYRTGRGHAYLFTRDLNGSWTQNSIIKDSLAAEYDWFGQSVSLCGSYMLIGVPGLYSFAGNGSTYLYDISSNNPVFIRKLEADTLQPGAQYGSTTLMTETYAFAATSGFDYYNIPYGKVCVFDRRTQFSRSQIIEPPTDQEYSYFGWFIACNDSILAVGEPRAIVGGEERGAVRLYGKNTSSLWELTKTIFCPDTEKDAYFGCSICLTDSILVIGSRYNYCKSGAFYLYKFINAAWTLVDKVNSSDGRMGDLFGSAVRTNGRDLVVSAPNHDAGAIEGGAVYVYRIGESVATKRSTTQCVYQPSLVGIILQKNRLMLRNVDSFKQIRLSIYGIDGSRYGLFEIDNSRKERRIAVGLKHRLSAGAYVAEFSSGTFKKRFRYTVM